jgi:6-phosphogluconolactonase/glucosamine-6-phosphate isomerase/deaminase
MRSFNTVGDVSIQTVTTEIETIMASISYLINGYWEKKAYTLTQLIGGNIHEDSPVSMLQKPTCCGNYC